MKKSKVILVMLLCLLFLSGFSFKKVQIINPKYEAYMELSEEDKANVKIIPPKYIFNIEKVENDVKSNSKSNILGVTTFPTTYNLRNVGGVNYVSPTKDQENAGLCWSFASNNALESYLLKKNIKKNGVAYNLSENVAGYVGKYYGDVAKITSGNYLYKALDYWFRGNGPVEESIFGPYSDSEVSSKAMDLYMDNKNVSINVDGSVIFDMYNYNAMKSYPWSTQQQFMLQINEPIKQHLMENGAIATGISVYGDFYDVAENTFYDDGTVPPEGTSNYTEYMNSGHAVTIIGWDDNKYDVNKDGVGDGAWLALNSWGTCTSCYEIIWISYYDASALSQKSGVTEASVKNFDNIYNNYYDNPTLPATNTRKHKFYVGDADEMVTGVRINNIEAINIENALQNNFTISIKNKDGINVTSESIKPVFGTQTIDFNNVPVNGVVEVTVTGIISSEMYDIVLLTKQSDTSKKVYSTTSIKNNENFDNDINNQIDYTISTKNILSGKTLDVKIFDGSNSDISNKFTIIKDSHLLNGQMTASIKLKEELDTFKIKVNLTIDNVTKTFEYSVFALVGEGSAVSPYLIVKPTDLVYLEGSTKYFKLMNDLDIMLYTANKSGLLNTNNNGWKPVNFSGHLDGNGKTIYGLTSKVGGLFSTFSGTVSNLRLKYSNINCEGTSAIEMSCGSLANVSNGGIVTNVDISDSVIKGTMYAGALFGAAGNGTVTNVIVKNSDISASNIAGGLIGNICVSDEENMTITNTFITNNKIHLFGTINTINPGNLGGNISYYVTETATMPKLTMTNNYYTTAINTTDRNAVNLYAHIDSEVTNNSGNVINGYDVLPYIITTDSALLSEEESKVSTNYKTFDFTNFWKIDAGKTPILKKFVKESVSVLSYETGDYLETGNNLIVNERVTSESLNSTITVPAGVTFTIYSKNGSVLNNTSNVGTGSMIVITNGEDIVYLPVVVLGDATGDGIVNVSDVTFVADYVLFNDDKKEKMLDNIYQLVAANVIQSSTTGINVGDVTKIADYTLNPSNGW